MKKTIVLSRVLWRSKATLLTSVLTIILCYFRPSLVQGLGWNWHFPDQHVNVVPEGQVSLGRGAVGRAHRKGLRAGSAAV